MKQYATVERWLSNVDTHSKATEKLYLYFLERFCQFMRKTPDQLIKERQKHLSSTDEFVRRRHEERLKKFCKWLETKQGLARNSAVTAHNIIKSFYKNNYMPLVVLKSPRGQDPRPRKVPTQAELALMVKVAGKPHDQALILVMAQSGLGLAEFMTLTYKHIKREYEQGIIPVHLAMVRKKTGKAFDTFLGTDSILALRFYLAQRERPLKLSTPLFKRPYRSVQHLITDVSSAADFEPYCTSHSLRKFFSTRLRLARCPDQLVDYWMGHVLPYGGAYMVPSDIEEQRALYAQYEHALSIRPQQRAPTLETKFNQLIQEYGAEQIRALLPQNRRTI